MLALNMAAIPMIMKLSGITFASKKVFKIVANNKPRKAPINMLGAKTPPSPPEANVIEVIMGFRNKIPIMVNTKEVVSTTDSELTNWVFTA